MAKVWITYAWDDNKEADVDFIAQHLQEAGITVNIDRLVIRAGERIWPQIENSIQDPGQADAWIIYGTSKSFSSEACREEYAYALDRAIRHRGKSFPIIGLFPGGIDELVIPAGIRTRLYVRLDDPDWKERTVAAIEGRSPELQFGKIDPFVVKIHSGQVVAPRKYAIEIRPRAGVWAPFMVAIPISEFAAVSPLILRGSAGVPPQGGFVVCPERGATTDGAWWIEAAQDAATPSESYFLFCDRIPSAIQFGKLDGPPQFHFRPRA